jgi:general nucleoside transport system ATP-binding protein
LALDAIRRSYGPVLALDSASFTIGAGEVHALLGENGAGKSTLMKIAYGLDRPDSGTLAIDGRAVTLRSPRDAMSHGIGMVQQHFALVEAMTVAENVALGARGRLDLRSATAVIERIGRESGLALNPHALVRDLPVGAQQRLEIVRALARNTTTLILDEPTAVLSPHESAELLAWTRRFADGGGSVVLIAHKLREVLSIADRVTVLRRGRTVLSARARDVDESSLAAAMLGESSPSLLTIVPRANAKTAAAVMTLTHIRVIDTFGVLKLTDASLTVRAGEIVGVAAIEGAGQYELLRVLAGLLSPSAGTATVPAVVGFVPEDRHREAVVLDATLTENVALRGAGKRRGIIDWSALRSETSQIMRRRDVRAAGEGITMRTLSGGNQQKLVIGRELAASPAALIVENPTRGLDIRATSEVHSALRDARDAGTAVVVYCSDLDEVITLADRVVVVASGRVIEVVADRDAVGRTMLEGAV